MHEKIFVANWKMELTFSQVIDVIEGKDFYNLAPALNSNKLILCPSFESISTVVTTVKQYQINVNIGAQDCSGEDLGPYTGQVSAASLKEIGVTHCIIGHSERRNAFQETPGDIIRKTQQLLKHAIIPIICIGEKEKKSSLKEIIELLDKQLKSIKKITLLPEYQDAVIYIAYEPAWAIGSHQTPETKILDEIFEWLSSQLGPENALLYGGSVTEENIADIALVAGCDGFLIGKASCDIKRLKKMLQLVDQI